MRIVVTGASSLIGHFLLPKLVAENHQVIAISRNPARVDSLSETCEWRVADIGVAEISIAAPYVLFHIAPLWLLPDLLQRLSGNPPVRLIAFGSTSRISKASSTNDHEREVADRLARAEDKVAAISERLDIPWTIFRPTLIYGGALDKNITSIARFIRYFGFFPLIGEASGRRMPVHAEDLAKACLNCMAQDSTRNKIYTLSGGEILSYQEMVKRIFYALDKKPRFLQIPGWSLRWALSALSRWPGYTYLSPEMVNRINQDLVYKATEAIHDFGYDPRGFTPRKSDLFRSKL